MDPFIFFVDTIKGKLKYPRPIIAIIIVDVCMTYSLFKIIFPVVIQSSDPARFESLSQTLEFNYQALANGVAQHAEQRRVEIEKEKLEKSATAAAP